MIGILAFFLSELFVCEAPMKFASFRDIDSCGHAHE